MSKDINSRSKLALLSRLLEDRRLGWAMLAGGLVYFAFSLAGISLMTCPVRQLTHWQCPGCGLTRGTRAMLEGDWRSALGFHWFTPVFMVFWAAVGLGLLIPEPWRGKFLRAVRKSEQRTYWPAILAVLLIIYALTRNIIEA